MVCRCIDPLGPIHKVCRPMMPVPFEGTCPRVDADRKVVGAPSIPPAAWRPYRILGNPVINQIACILGSDIVQIVHIMLLGEPGIARRIVHLGIPINRHTQFGPAARQFEIGRIGRRRHLADRSGSFLAECGLTWMLPLPRLPIPLAMDLQPAQNLPDGNMPSHMPGTAKFLNQAVGHRR